MTKSALNLKVNKDAVLSHLKWSVVLWEVSWQKFQCQTLFSQLEDYKEKERGTGGKGTSPWGLPYSRYLVKFLKISFLFLQPLLKGIIIIIILQTVEVENGGYVLLCFLIRVFLIDFCFTIFKTCVIRYL